MHHEHCWIIGSRIRCDKLVYRHLVSENSRISSRLARIRRRIILDGQKRRKRTSLCLRNAPQARSAEQSRVQRRTGANLFDRAEERSKGEFDGAARATATAGQRRRR
ncbi:uncharacterized protein [Arachis hypogaea]|uniref:uncharacterized protein n=1 Tax=Arachis hypogaea TaxID=3818 RepID=UPI0011057241|nr:uncharacterized protein LOC112766537 [Arachis hypogaea]QHN91516.1 uncharacterized protein DS421_17g575520 [Arachis hypogaea]